MAFVIAEPCINVKDTACVEVCPVDCIYEGEDQLFIHPTECIDCGACEPVCPVEAIFSLEKVPGAWSSFIQKNAEFFEAHPDAKPAIRKGEAPESEAAVTTIEAVAPSVEAEKVETEVPIEAETATEKPQPVPTPVAQKPIERPERARPFAVVERPATVAKAEKPQPEFKLKDQFGFIVKVSQPLTGALSSKFKRELEDIAQDPQVFSSSVATGFNCLLNTILYLLIFTTIGIKSYGLYSETTNLYIFIGLALGILETAIRFKNGMIASPNAENDFPATWYGKPLSFLLEPILPIVRERFLEPIVAKAKPQVISMPAATIYAEDLKERDRRYGLVHSMVEQPDRYIIKIEFPRHVPYSKRKNELGLPDEMPDYKRQITLQGRYMMLEARLEDPRILQVAGRSSSFPSSFICEFRFSKDVFGFEDKLEGKEWQITVYKKK